MVPRPKRTLQPGETPFRLVGTIVEVFGRSGRDIVNIAAERVRFDVEIDTSMEFHLGDQVELDAVLRIERLRPFVPARNDESQRD